MSTEYAVKAETHEGKIMTLRRGFASHDAAEDHPVQISLWKRVWVEGVETPPIQPPSLPPLPWDWVASGATDARGKYNAYLIDATGRKIAAIWGREGEKALIADAILSAVNAAPYRSPTSLPEGEVAALSQHNHTDSK